MDVLVIFVVVLGLITLIGHGIWLFLATIFRALVGMNPGRESEEPAEECPQCGRFVPPLRHRCETCGLDLESPQAEQLSDLGAMDRQLRRFVDENALDKSTYLLLQQKIKMQREGLTGRRTPVRAVPPLLRPASTQVQARVPDGDLAALAPRVEIVETLPIPSTPAPPVAPVPATPVPVAPVPVAPILAEVVAPEPLTEVPATPVPATPVPAILIADIPVSAPMPVSPIAVPVEPPPPRRTFLELLGAFMEQSNILWGELVGGLLIVGCSIALVISLWPKLEQNPVYQFGIFVGVTVLLFGIGLYTLHHWKLDSTSRGLLVIATLLVPLNFLAIAAQARGAGGSLEIVLELASLAVFAGLLRATARILVPEGERWFLLAVLGTSASQLVIPRLLQHGDAWLLPVLLGLVPVACHALGSAGLLYHFAPRDKDTAERTQALFTYLGISTFAVGVALGLLRAWNVAVGGEPGTVLAHLAVLVALAGLPLVSVGLRLSMDSGVDSDSAPPQSALTHTAATATALTGMFVMLLAAALAWRVPVALGLVCAFDFAVLTYIAYRHALPIAHAAALPCLAIGFLTAFHLWHGQPLAEHLFDAQSGTALVLLFVLMAVIAEALCRAAAVSHAVFYAVGSGLVALASMTLVTFPMRGLDEPATALWVYGLYGVAGLVVNARWRQPVVSSLSLALLVGASLWALWWLIPLQVPLWSAVLAGEALGMGMVAALLRRQGGIEFPPVPPAQVGNLCHPPETALPRSRAPALLLAYAEPLARSAEGLVPLALLAAFWSGLSALAWSFAYIITGTCLAGLFLLLAGIERRANLARLSGVTLIGTAVAGFGWLADILGDVLSTAAPQEVALIGLGVSLAGTFMAAVTRGFSSGEESWRSVLRTWRETAGVAVVLALIVTRLSLSIGVSTLPTYTDILLAATCLLLAWEYEAPLLTWSASMLVLGSFVHALTRTPPTVMVPTPWLQVGFLCHATVALLASLILKRWSAERTHHWLRVPLGQSGLASSFLVLTVLFQAGPGMMAMTALCLFWLALLWLIVAWTERWPWLFTALQADVCMAVVLGTTALLEGREWFAYDRILDPWNLQAYGAALGLLGLGWMAARLALRYHPVAHSLLEPPWPTVDRVVLAGLVLGQALVAALCLAPAASEWFFVASPEFHFWPEAERAHAFGTGAWGLLGLLAVVLVLSLWERRADAAVPGLLMLALTVPVLLAGGLGEGRPETPLLLRWGLGTCYLACSVPIWLRRPLFRAAGQLKCRIHEGRHLSAWARGLLALGAAAPAFGLTLAAVLLSAGMNPPASFLGHGLPLTLLCLGLVGHALRERSAGYTFAAGLVFSFMLAAGHTLGFMRSHLPLHGTLWEQLWIQTIQVATISAGVWALAWLGVRALARGAASEGRELSVDETVSPLGEAFLPLQLGLVLVGNALLLGGAFGWLTLAEPPYVPMWTSEAGSVLGWLSLLITTGTLGLHGFQQRWRVRPRDAGFLGLVLLGLTACTIARIWPDWGYRSLMLAWSAYPLAWVLAAWGVSLRKEEQELPSDWLEATAFWVRAAGVLGVLLALKAVLWYQDHLWSAGAIALASPACAVVAIWRRREGWAFMAGLGVNLAASLVVWHYHRTLDLSEWWVVLLQANVSAAAAVALLWLGLRHRLYGRLELRLNTGPRLANQIGLAILGNLVLLVVPIVILFVHPEQALPAAIMPAGHVWGWLALALTLAAAGWYGSQVAAWSPISLVTALGLGVGALSACWTSQGDTAGKWLAFHDLTATWTLAGLATLVVARRLPGVRSQESGVRNQESGVRSQECVLIGGAVVLLAARGIWDDPARPYWSAGALLVVCLMTATLAVWSSRPVLVYVAGLLVNMVGLVLWVAWGTHTLEGFVQVQVLCFALAAVLWSLPELAGRRREMFQELGAVAQPFVRAASTLAIMLLTSLVVYGVLVTLNEWPRGDRGEILGWSALGVTVLAFGLRLGSTDLEQALEGLYALGLLSICMVLESLRLSPRDFLQFGALGLSLYLFVAVIAWDAARKHQEAHPGAPLGEWFVIAQGVVALVIAGLTVWMSLEGEYLGPKVLALTLPSFVSMIRAQHIPASTLASGINAARARQATLLVGALVAVEIGWVLIGTESSSLVLYRTVALMGALALATVLYGLVLPPRLSLVWAESCRRSGPVFGVVAALILLVVLAQEGWLYAGTSGEAAAGWAVAVVAMALAALIVAGLTFAVRPSTDPFALSERGRTFYVYAAEVLLVLIFVHFRLTLPELYRHGLMARFWPFVVMALAFAGAGLSEYFARQGLRVLAEPLERTGIFLPLLPVLSFWLMPAASFPPGNYAFVWFLAGLLYGFLAVSKRSFRFALLAALAANMGLWVLLHQRDVFFVKHPQLWLIPLALIVLVAEHLHRARLTLTQGATLRYLALVVIYVSSTADMFIAGLGERWEMPLVLAFLSVLGILAGMVLRIRAFLLLGISFLLLVVLTMIFYAGVDQQQTWILWTSGIVLGAAILALFGVFEKRRNDVLKLIEDLKQWQ